MRYIVKVKLGEEMEWPERIVDADDKWGALVKAVEELGLEARMPMGEFWKWTSIKKEEKRAVRKWRQK